MNKFRLHPSFLLIALLVLGAFQARATGLVVTPGDNVGIGTTSPSFKLSVAGGNVQLLSGNSLLFENSASDNHVRIYNPGGSGSASLQIDTNSIGTLYLSTSGNVGIGTTSPGYKLTVSGDIALDDGNALIARSSQGKGCYSIHFANAGPHYPLRFVGSSDSVTHRYFEFGYYSGENVANAWNPTFVVDSYTGSIGIGTANPSQLLHVYSTGNTQETIESTGAANVVQLNLKSGAVTWQLGNNSNCTNHPLVFQDGTHINVSLLDNGNVGIGMLYPNYKLDVAGTIHCGEIITNNYDWADYVFDKDYKLAPLSEVEKTIQSEKHLPGIPSANEVAKHGVDLGKMQAQLLQKIEELTLHQIEQEKRLDEQSQRISQLEKENATLRAQR